MQQLWQNFLKSQAKEVDKRVFILFIFYETLQKINCSVEYIVKSSSQHLPEGGNEKK